MSANKRSSLLYQLPKIESHTNDEHLQLLRIHCNEKYTKIDLGYTATDYFISGGWINIDPETFIELKETGERLQMTRAENIPIAPEQLHFASTKEWRYFSLYFPPVPKEKCTIDLIEIENATENNFNFYGIRLDPEKAQELRQL